VTDAIPIGYGLPFWLPTRVYLSAEETRHLPPTRHTNGGTCLVCGNPPCGPTFALEGAHIVTKGSGGRRDKKEGPTVEACYKCHHVTLHGGGNITLAVRRDTLTPVLLLHWAMGPVEVEERALRWRG
jgi:hypothetical protein